MSEETSLQSVLEKATSLLVESMREKKAGIEMYVDDSSHGDDVLDGNDGEIDVERGCIAAMPSATECASLLDSIPSVLPKSGNNNNYNNNNNNFNLTGKRN